MRNGDSLRAVVEERERELVLLGEAAVGMVLPSLEGHRRVRQEDGATGLGRSPEQLLRERRSDAASAVLGSHEGETPRLVGVVAQREADEPPTDHRLTFEGTQQRHRLARLAVQEDPRLVLCPHLNSGVAELVRVLTQQSYDFCYPKKML